MEVKVVENDSVLLDNAEPLETRTVIDSVTEVFISFYDKFRTDSTFQLSRVQFPIRGKFNSYEEERDWTAKKWPLMKWDYRIEKNNLDDSVSIVQDENKFFYGTYCIDCGFSFEMQFDKLEGKWFLTYRQENNY